MTNLLLDDIGVTDDLATYLQSVGAGVCGQSIFSGQEPDSAPDPSLVLYTYGGEPLEHVHDSRTAPFETHRVQVTSRAADLEQARKRAWIAYRALQLTNFWLNQRFYGWVEPLGMPIRLGVDANDRHVFTFNLRVTRRN